MASIPKKKADRKILERPASPAPVRRGVPKGWVLVPDKPNVEWIRELRSRTSYAQAERAIELILATAPKYGEDK